MSSSWSTALEVAGLGCFCWAGFLGGVVVGLIVLGVTLTYVGYSVR